MKRSFLLTCFSILTIFSFAQNEKNPYPRTITVSGSAETELVPDEIYVQVDLKEYEKKGVGKISIDAIKNTFLANARSLGIPDSAISIAAYDGQNGNPWWKKKKKQDELLASISYLVKLKKSTQVDELVQKLDDNATQNFYIQRTSHSRLAEWRRQLKIQAVKAAKDKAGYLAAAIDEKIGEAVAINEPSEFYIPYYNLRPSNTAMRDRAEAAPVEEAQVDFTKIKLKYEVTVVFALK